MQDVTMFHLLPDRELLSHLVSRCGGCCGGCAGAACPAPRGGDGALSQQRARGLQGHEASLLLVLHHDLLLHLADDPLLLLHTTQTLHLQTLRRLRLLVKLVLVHHLATKTR